MVAWLTAWVIMEYQNAHNITRKKEMHYLMIRT